MDCIYDACDACDTCDACDGDAVFQDVVNTYTTDQIQYDPHDYGRNYTLSDYNYRQNIKHSYIDIVRAASITLPISATEHIACLY